MGEFLVRIIDQESGRVLSRFAVPNLIAHEGAPRILRRIFPPVGSGVTYALGVCGVTVNGAEESPNIAGGFAFDANLTFADVTGIVANEGGCYTDGMRTSFGYSRQNVTFTTVMESDGGAFYTDDIIFSNNHQWVPQPKEDWDFPWTPNDIEQAPPEWQRKFSWEPEVGYPWQQPRKKCTTDCENSSGGVCSDSYMHFWDNTGELDWLCDFRKISGFPITMLFLADTIDDKLIAAARFRRPILLRPGCDLQVAYRARIFGRNTSRDFAFRLADYAFGNNGSRYAVIYCRPVLSSITVSRKTTYAQIEAHFHSNLEPIGLPLWTVQTGPPPVIQSDNFPEWENTAGKTLGPFRYIAVYGEVGLVGGPKELMWVTKIDPEITLENGDWLKIPSGLKFWLEGI